MTRILRRIQGIIAVVGVAAVASCAGSDGPVVSVRNHSFAKVDEALVEHIDLDLTVDFAAQRIHGRASLRIANLAGTSQLILDSRGLKIHNVTMGRDEVQTKFFLGETDPVLGEPLVIDITPETEEVHIDYESAEDASALGWLEPQQTSDGRYPFLYTQGQSIQNRSWIPCQDTPEVRVTYSATIRTPPGMMAVMSARNPSERNSDGVYHFDMPQPIAPYLIALAVGDIDFGSISDRCGVYAEPSIVDAAVWEFADTEEMMQKAEALYGPYRWERFDVIVLPPSFPFGGMENPRLTFVTPVLVAGDRSLVSTIAHELAHSWSGNLVTNATWDDFWLNEGFTTYFERRILEAVYGTERMEMDAQLGFTELQKSLARVEADDPDTRLHTELEGRDPEDGVGWVAYEKGYLFLRLIEEAVGRERWDSFLRGYFDVFAFQPMTTDRFVAHLQSNLLDGNPNLEESIGIDAWIHGTGVPDNKPVIRSDAFDKVAAVVESWKGGTPPNELETEGWTTQQWKEFVQRLPAPLTVEQMTELDKSFRFTSESNGEIHQVWFVKAIEAGYEPAYPAIEEYLTTIGRIWLIGAVYRKLAETPEGLDRARKIYETAKSGYHPMTVGVVDRILASDD